MFHGRPSGLALCVGYIRIRWVEYKTTWAARVILGSSVRDTVNLTVRTLTKPSVLSKSIVGPSANYTLHGEQFKLMVCRQMSAYRILAILPRK